MLEIERTYRDKQNGIVVVTPEGKALTFYITWIGENRCKIKFVDNPDFMVLRKELHEKIKNEQKIVDDLITKY